MMQVKSDYLVGNGAALNVELGWIPDFVTVYNLTDADEWHSAFLGGGNKIIPFSGGGTTEIVIGDKITGATSGATARVVKVLEYSGTWAGGDAAGFFVVRDVTGTFSSENVKVGSGTDDATVTAAVNHTLSVIDSGSGATDIAATTGNDALSQYTGAEGSASLGFTIGSGIAEEAKLLYYVAGRNL